MYNLYPKLDEIRLLVLESEPDILRLTETWLNDSHTNSEIHIPNYNLYRKDRADGYGGVVLYTHSRLETNLITLSQSLHGKIDTLWVKQTLPCSLPVLAGIVYGPKVCCEYFEDLDSVLKEVDGISVMSRTPAENFCIVDFNCDGLNPNEWEWRKLNSTVVRYLWF